MCTDGRRCENCPSQRLAAGSGLIAAALPALGTVVAVTANDAALLSHTGQYGPPVHPGGALVCGDDQVHLRMNPDVVGYLAPRALSLVGTYGSHRAWLTPMVDHLVLEGLSLAPAGEPVAFSPTDWTTADWDDTDQLDHLDSLTSSRYEVLPFTGARRIDPRVLPYLLAHLVEDGVAFTIAVPGGGCVQLHRGRAAMAEDHGSHFAVIFGAARYALDPLHVSECWATRAHGAAGPTSALEVYDHGRRCVTVLTLTGTVFGPSHDAWEAVIGALPGA